MHSSSTTSPTADSSDEPKHFRRKGRKRFKILFTLGEPPYGGLRTSTEKYETAKARDQALAEWHESSKTGWRTKAAGWAATPIDL
jgi:hypothetical protein